MKTLELDLKKKVLIVDLPIDSKNVYMSGNSIIYNTDKSCIAKPINDEYEFLCKGSELTEEIASELIEKFELDFNKEFCVFKDYINDCNRFSFETLEEVNYELYEAIPDNNNKDFIFCFLVLVL